MQDAAGTTRIIRADFGQLGLISRISLWLSMLAIAGLAIIFFTVSPPADNYLQNISTLTISRASLPWIMLISGLILTFVTGVVTWLATLYVSFRIAGPLFRFSRNIEQWTSHGRSGFIPLRKGDFLQDESKLIQTSLSTYNKHLEEYHQLLDQTLENLDKANTDQLNHHLKLLKDKVNSVFISRHANLP